MMKKQKDLLELNLLWDICFIQFPLWMFLGNVLSSGKRRASVFMYIYILLKFILNWEFLFSTIQFRIFHLCTNFGCGRGGFEHLLEHYSQKLADLSFILEESVYNINGTDLMNFAWQVSKGMSYLADMKVRINVKRKNKDALPNGCTMQHTLLTSVKISKVL